MAKDVVLSLEKRGRNWGKTDLILKSAVSIARSGRTVAVACWSPQRAKEMRERVEREYGDVADLIEFRPQDAATREGKGPKAMDDKTAERQRAFRQEVTAILNVVEARLRNEPKTSEEWAVIVQQLGQAKRRAEYAMRALAEQEETRVSSPGEVSMGGHPEERGDCTCAIPAKPAPEHGKDCPVYLRWEARKEVG